jgi:hypothetical protein
MKTTTKPRNLQDEMHLCTYVSMQHREIYRVYGSEYMNKCTENCSGPGTPTHLCDKCSWEMLNSIPYNTFAAMCIEDMDNGAKHTPPVYLSCLFG